MTPPGVTTKNERPKHFVQRHRCPLCFRNDVGPPQPVRERQEGEPCTQGSPSRNLYSSNLSNHCGRATRHLSLRRNTSHWSNHCGQSTRHPSLRRRITFHTPRWTTQQRGDALRDRTNLYFSRRRIYVAALNTALVKLVRRYTALSYFVAETTRDADLYFI